MIKIIERINLMVNSAKVSQVHAFPHVCYITCTRTLSSRNYDCSYYTKKYLNLNTILFCINAIYFICVPLMFLIDIVINQTLYDFMYTWTPPDPRRWLYTFNLVLGIALCSESTRKNHKYWVPHTVYLMITLISKAKQDPVIISDQKNTDVHTHIHKLHCMY